MADLTLRQIYQMSDDEAERFLVKCRWPDGKYHCPDCGCDETRVVKNRPVVRCAACRKQYSVKSGTAVSSAKFKYQDLIALVFLFCSSAKGISSLQLSRTVGLEQKSTWVMLHKIREVITNDVDQQRLSGMVEIDGATFGGHSKLENNRRNGFEQRIYHKNFKNRRIIVVARERDGRTVPFVGFKESDAKEALERIIEPGSVIQADQAHAWDGLEKLFDMLRVNHKWSFSHNGACTNYAESFWAMLRKSHRGTYHKWSGELARQYACEMAWLQDFRHLETTDRTKLLLSMLLNAPVSRRFSKYWQLSSVGPEEPNGSTGENSNVVL